MRALFSIVALVGCGGSPPPPAHEASPATVQPDPVKREPEPRQAGVYGEASLQQPAPAKTESASTALLARLPIGDGPVAGLDAFTIGHRADPNHCGGVAVTITRVRGKRVPDDDAKFAALLELPAPTRLDFSPDHKQASMDTFNAWVDQLKRRSAAAIDQYQAKVSSKDPRDKAVAAARIAQVSRYFATVLARMELPIDVHTGDYADLKIAAFCDETATVAEPLLAHAEEVERVCASLKIDGWWTAVCGTGR